MALGDGDPSCALSISRRNITAACGERCGALLDDIIDNCDNTVSEYIDIYSTALATYMYVCIY